MATVVAPAAWRVRWTDDAGDRASYVTESHEAAVACEAHAKARGSAVTVEALVSLPVVLEQIHAALAEPAR